MVRPVAVTFGPDGCLYITDWYNRIISHNEVARDHPGRDKTRGRVWRIRHKSQTPRPVPDMTRVPTQELPQHLAAGSIWEMRAAWQQIATRGTKEVAGELKKILRETKDDGVRIHSLWALEDTGSFDAALWKELLASANANVRREAVRAMSSLKVPRDEAFALFQPLAEESAWTVRYELMRFFRRATATPEQLQWLGRWTQGPADQTKVNGWNGPFLALGGAYERAFQDFLYLLITDKTAAFVVDAKWDTIVATQAARSADDSAAIAKRIATIKAQIASAADRPTDEARTFVQTTCLACHRIGDKGIPLAPPLDGSASRDIDGIITSIVDPDAAIENVFRLYRVEQKDGAVLEGFRKSTSESELTLMFMGGGTKSIPYSAIKSAGYVAGKSVMLPLAAGLSDTQVADIVRYLKTVK
jgi:putative heme-binding domain-containing protein